MLCPNCGSEVGDRLTLCEKCKKKAAEQESLARDAALAENHDAASTEASGPKTPSEDPPGAGKNVRKGAGRAAKSSAVQLALGLFLILAVLLAAAVFLFDIPGTSTEMPADFVPVSAVRVEGEEQGGAESTDAPVASAQASTRASSKTLYTEVYSDVSGFVESGFSRTANKDALILYQPALRKFEIAFFSEQLSTEQRSQVLSIASLADQSLNPAPEALLSIWFSKASPRCSSTAISQASLLIGSEGEKRSLPVESSVLDSFSCELAPGKKLHLETTQAVTRENSGGAERFSWELSVSAPIYFASKAPSVSVFSEDLSQLALWNPAEKALSIGFFERLPDAAGRAQLQNSAELTAVKKNQPLYSIHFELQDKPKQLRKSDIRSYGVVFHRLKLDDGGSIEIPAAEPIGIYFAPSSERSPALSAIEATLFQGASVTGSMQDSAVLETRGGEVEVNWKLDLDAPILTVNDGAGSASAASSAMIQQVAGETRGAIRLGSAQAKIIEARALWYPEEGNLLIGFYNRELDSSDSEAIARYKTIWIPKRFAQPVFTLALDLKPGIDEFSLQHLRSATFTFVREKLGSFYFPGNRERKGVKLMTGQLSAGNLILFDTKAKSGAGFALRSRAELDSLDGQEVDASWDVAISTGLMVVGEAH